MLETESEIFKRKEEFRLRHRKASNAKEDVMRRYYSIERNLNAPVRIDAPTLERVIGKYGSNGMICIRTDNAVHASKFSAEFCAVVPGIAGRILRRTLDFVIFADN